MGGVPGAGMVAGGLKARPSVNRGVAARAVISGPLG